MPQPVISGQTLLDDLTLALGGRSNAFNSDNMMQFVNAGVNEVWGVLRSLDLDYFMDSTQTGDSTQDDYFSVLTSTKREYALPADCRDVRLIECTTVGFQELNFERRDVSNEEFKQRRRAALASGSGTFMADGNTMMYAIIGQNTVMFSDYPPASVTLKLWYVKSLAALTIDSTLTEILYPFTVKIVDYATQKALLSLSNVELSAAWMMEWKDSVKTLAITSGPRDSTGPIFIMDYAGQ